MNDEVTPGWYMHDARASGGGFAGYTGPLACAATVYYLSAGTIAEARSVIQERRSGCEFRSDRERPITSRDVLNTIRVRVPYPTVASIPLRDMVRLDADLGTAFEALLRDQSEAAAKKADEEAKRLSCLARDAERPDTYPWGIAEAAEPRRVR